ncbi:MAG TPA: prolyl oligopeptidase family serine peptidase [Candidatus Dormibacteraeota bacterium]|nr:prolyl oligopeptidase family serine peptidase [Candidatus Dormibacteraeota bacterium]
MAAPTSATDRARVEKLLSVVRATRPLPDVDGALFYASNVTGRSQVFREGERLHEGESRMVPHAHTPGGLLIRADDGGNEIWQLGMLRGGEYRPLTTDQKAIHRSVTLHPNKHRVGLSWNPGGQADLVLGELDLESRELTPWATPGGFWEWGAWSPDGERAIVVKIEGTPTAAYILERDGTMTRLLSRALRVRPVEWLEEGLLLLTDLDRDFMGLVFVDPERPDDVARRLFDEDHDTTGAVLDSAATKVAIVVNEGIYDGIRIVDLRTASTIDRMSLPPGVVIDDHTGGPDYHLTWKPDGSGLYVSWEQPSRPAEIFEWPGAVRRTFSSDPPSGLVDPVETSYRSFDGLEIPGLIYRVDDAPRPAVVQFHGGPEGQSRGGFVPQAHLLNAIGINLFLPNVRGSTGYGMRYQSLDDKTLRWNGVKDGCEAARHLKKSGVATKTAAMGGSYGGFMTLAVLVEDPDLWDAGVDVVGIADWHTFFANMPPWRGGLRVNEYGDPKGAEADYLREISPIHRAGAIKAPLLVIHGRNDPRVPAEESEQIARATGAELMIFDDEGHGIAALANQVTSNRRILEFLAEHLS